MCLMLDNKKRTAVTREVTDGPLISFLSYLWNFRFIWEYRAGSTSARSHLRNFILIFGHFLLLPYFPGGCHSRWDLHVWFGKAGYPSDPHLSQFVSLAHRKLKIFCMYGNGLPTVTLIYTQFDSVTNSAYVRKHTNLWSINISLIKVSSFWSLFSFPKHQKLIMQN